ncbi:response regulator transcription factor [Sphingomonas glacialis]|uniref:DNA-binding response regulator n=1 Tax=Sphingomonas glacialis TaxID=658225 RepID=A0A502FR82_9SPHN|nr:response regulator transcription factor [Sphingomonas glacialis]TPG52067.1 DNA-binding response regulator [Sphingomonas glacialis]
MAEISRKIRVLIADDHPMLRDGVAAVINGRSDMEVVGEAENGRQAVEMYASLRPDVTLMDLQMPGIGGVEAIEAIRRGNPSAQIVVLTTYSGDAQALQALKAGASAYLLKSAMRSDLVDAIRTVHAGRRHVQAEVAQGMAEHATEDPLNARELQVLRLIAAGNANKEIAAKLSLAEDTVKAHIRNIFAKLYVTDRTHAVTTAARRGIIEL